MYLFLSFNLQIYSILFLFQYCKTCIAVAYKKLMLQGFISASKLQCQRQTLQLDAPLPVHAVGNPCGGGRARGNVGSLKASGGASTDTARLQQMRPLSCRARLMV